MNHKSMFATQIVFAFMICIGHSAAALGQHREKIIAAFTHTSGSAILVGAHGPEAFDWPHVDSTRGQFSLYYGQPGSKMYTRITRHGSHFFKHYDGRTHTLTKSIPNVRTPVTNSPVHLRWQDGRLKTMVIEVENDRQLLRFSYNEAVLDELLLDPELELVELPDFLNIVAFRDIKSPNEIIWWEIPFHNEANSQGRLLTLHQGQHSSEELHHVIFEPTYKTLPVTSGYVGEIRFHTNPDIDIPMGRLDLLRTSWGLYQLRLDGNARPKRDTYIEVTEHDSLPPGILTMDHRPVIYPHPCDLVFSEK